MRPKRLSISRLLLFSAAALFISGYTLIVPPDSFGASDKGDKEKILVNFKNVELTTLIKYISEKTGRNIVYDDKVRGKVTIIAPTEIYSKDAFSLFVSILELKGFTVIDMGTAYKVIPSVKARQSSFTVDTGKGTPRVKGFIARVERLNFIEPETVISIIKPLMSPEGYATPLRDSGAVLLLDTSMNIDKVKALIDIIDIESPLATPDIVYLKNSDIDIITGVLKDHGVKVVADVKKGPKGFKGSARALKVIPNKRLNALFLFGPEVKREELKALIALLDVAAPPMSSNINVYYLENADATEIAKIMERIVGAKGTGMGDAPMRMTGSVAIMPDKNTNSLVIKATPTDYLTILNVVKKLDRRPKQVFVEAMIVEVSINDALDLGTRWRAAAKVNGDPFVVGGVGTVDTETVANLITGMAGASIGGIGNFFDIDMLQADGSLAKMSIPGFAALFSLADFKDVINVLSTPQILTSNNKEAEIIVGENVPFLSSIERASSTTNQPILQSIERKDVGITLRIKPQISEGDYVKLDIYQEISAIAPTTQAGSSEAADIITTKRSASTSVVVKDNQTVVIGGLIQDKKTTNTTKVPLLGDIPLIGWLFKYKGKAKQKTNLIVYITPRIVKDFEDLDDLRMDAEDTFNRGAADKDNKLTVPPAIEDGSDYDVL